MSREVVRLGRIDSSTEPPPAPKISLFSKVVSSLSPGQMTVLVFSAVAGILLIFAAVKGWIHVPFLR